MDPEKRRTVLTRLDFEEIITKKIMESPIFPRPFSAKLMARLASNQQKLINMKEKITDMSHHLKSHDWVLKKFEKNGYDPDSLRVATREVGLQVWETAEPSDMDMSPPPRENSPEWHDIEIPSPVTQTLSVEEEMMLLFGENPETPAENSIIEIVEPIEDNGLDASILPREVLSEFDTLEDFVAPQKLTDDNEMAEVEAEESQENCEVSQNEAEEIVNEKSQEFPVEKETEKPSTFQENPDGNCEISQLEPVEIENVQEIFVEKEVEKPKENPKETPRKKRKRKMLIESTNNARITRGKVKKDLILSEKITRKSMKEITAKYGYSRNDIFKQLPLD
jgi:hypothetical protein